MQAVKTIHCRKCKKPLDVPYWSGREFCDVHRPANPYKRRYTDEQVVEAMRRGGRNSNNGGFANNPQLAREAGRKGGMASRRGPKV